jgi:DNA-directed RNA polymerase subunit RPC12/RpoP
VAAWSSTRGETGPIRSRSPSLAMLNHARRNPRVTIALGVVENLPNAASRVPAATVSFSRRLAQMTSTFLHEDKMLRPDENAEADAPVCQACSQKMWLSKVTQVESDQATTETREYQCKSCGALATL